MRGGQDTTYIVKYQILMAFEYQILMAIKYQILMAFKRPCKFGFHIYSNGLN